jgi:hypothetical protein
MEDASSHAVVDEGTHEIMQETFVASKPLLFGFMLDFTKIIIAVNDCNGIEPYNCLTRYVKKNT